MFLRVYHERFPAVELDNYADGALMFSADAKSQFDSIMDFAPFLDVIEHGKRLWEKAFANGKTFAGCFPDGGRNAAGTYPRYDANQGRVVTFEMALNQCLDANSEAQLDYADMKTMGVLTAYARTLSDGMRMNIKVEGPEALAKYAAGKQFFFARQGQLDFACASCHLQNAGKILRTEILSPTIGQATHWPVFRGGDRLNTLQARYKRCMEQVRAQPPAIGSEAFNNLEYFHSYLSNGLPMHASVYRK